MTSSPQLHRRVAVVLAILFLGMGLGEACSSFQGSDATGVTGGDGGDGGDLPGDGSIALADGAVPPEGLITIPTATPFRIMGKEVTQSQYDVFLLAKGLSTDGQPSECTWNDSFAPTTTCEVAFDPANTPNLPVSCVDWCDAYAYCEFVGMRLCGDVNGGAVAESNTSKTSQWYAACSRLGTRVYPYGPNVSEDAGCNLGHPDGGRPVDTGSIAGCQGGFDGLFDMSGNVGEWEDSCRPGAMPDGGNRRDICRVRGGSFLSDSPEAGTCTVNYIAERAYGFQQFGVRCCSK